MAKSIRKAQAPLSCNLCNLQSVIKWKCTDCELLMCDNCKSNIHSRIKTADKHTIITIQEVGNHLSERLKALNISEVFSSVFNTYTTAVPGIQKLVCCADDIVFFMNNGDEYHFIKAKLLKGSLKILEKMDIECVDFAISLKQEILFSPAPGTNLIAASNTYMETKTVLETSPMLILAIHMSKHDELLLGLREQGPQFPVTDFSTRQVVVFGADYKRISTFERDDAGKRLFYYARRITTDSVNNIYVIDWLKDDEIGRIVSIDRNGGKRFFYNGCDSFNMHGAAFNPREIVVTSQDTTIISDPDNHALHALNANGELIGLQITKNLDILYPYSLCIDDEGFLLIGSNVNENAEIYVVKLLP
ncbi:TRIM71 [Mytilus coruscus]|uniref:TRIM71 n=1 Tax=Mytilus coruscus TaxID=42192 RepID=A0A6J7ZXV2_MYTCO|nr:TRIM71 [Mytilus coruscus]